jgi:hypothetical protein
MRIVGIVLLVLSLAVLAFLSYYLFMMQPAHCGGDFVCGKPIMSRVALALAAPAIGAIAGIWFIFRGPRRAA